MRTIRALGFRRRLERPRFRVGGQGSGDLFAPPSTARDPFDPDHRLSGRSDRPRYRESVIHGGHSLVVGRGTDGWLLLEGRRSRRRCDLKTLFVLQAIRSPGPGLKPALFDRSTVHDARAERAIGHAAQRVAHLLQYDRIAFGFSKCLERPLVRDARAASVMGRIDEFSPPWSASWPIRADRVFSRSSRRCLWC